MTAPTVYQVVTSHERHLIDLKTSSDMNPEDTCEIWARLDNLRCSHTTSHAQYFMKQEVGVKRIGILSNWPQILHTMTCIVHD